MPLPETVAGKDLCQLSDRWRTDVRVFALLATVIAFLDKDPRVKAAARLAKVISGYRTIQEQLNLGAQGRPAAPWQLSNHTTCPARAVDIRIEGFMSPLTNPEHRAIWRAFGEAAQSAGLRWGGGSPPAFPVGPGNPYFPSDFNHFDLGPRTDSTAAAFRAAPDRDRVLAGLHDVPTSPETF